MLRLICIFILVVELIGVGCLYAKEQDNTELSIGFVFIMLAIILPLIYIIYN